jgi:SAM-dependent methyltransferase
MSRYIISDITREIKIVAPAMKSKKNRSNYQKALDFITFPLRSVTLFEKDKGSLSSLQSERFDYVSQEITGYCLDVGCGPNNRFINNYLEGNGIGIDVYPYEGLTNDNIMNDMTKLPFAGETFCSATLIANINHIPDSIRKSELKEIYRVIRKEGNIIVTMGNPVAEIVIHKVVKIHDNVFKTNFDVDSERGMKEDERYYLKYQEIIHLLQDAGFGKISIKYFFTQWGLNGMIIGWKTDEIAHSSG